MINTEQNGDFPSDAFKLSDEKQAAFEKIVNDKYGGNLHKALEKAIDYFIVYENSNGMKSVSEKLREIQEKIERMRAASSQITSTIKNINQTNAQIQQNLKDNASKKE
ncbi:MAG: hypothetical protein SFU91_14655 [Chloroherpetonaceae bacterium]|nr:hypothetical protein [Chloroherpetonaceae bacterium]